MFRSACRSVILAATLSAALLAQRPMGRAPAPKGSGPQNPNNKKGNRNIIDKWARMAPDEREKALARLPPERRRKIEDQLNQSKNMTPQQRRESRSQIQWFNQLPPAKQNQARRLFRQFGEFPQPRQGMLRNEFETLSAMPEADRRSRINSDEFRNKYNSREQQFLADMSGLITPPK